MKVRSNKSRMSGTPGGTPGETLAGIISYITARHPARHPHRVAPIYIYIDIDIYTVYYREIPGETPEGTLARMDRFYVPSGPASYC